MSDEVVTFPVTLAGREIMFRRPHLGQILMMQRIATRALKNARETGERDAEAAAFTSSVSRTLDLVESLMSSEEDKAFVEEKMLSGEIDYMELVAVLGGKSPEAADDEAPKPVKKAPKKAPKAVATRARAKR